MHESIYIYVNNVNNRNIVKTKDEYSISIVTSQIDKLLQIADKKVGKNQNNKNVLKFDLLIIFQSC